MFIRHLTALALVAFAGLVAGQTPKEQPATNPLSGTNTVHGCYSYIGNMTLAFSAQYNSQGKCAEYCFNQTKVTAASFYKDCYCGDLYPPKSKLVDDSKCTEVCPGFGEHACGGLGTFTVYHTGYRLAVGEMEDPSASTTGSSTQSSPTGVPAASGSSSQTATSAPSNTGGPNTVGIAVGVVVGILAIAGIGGAVFFILRRRRNSELEEEHRRNAAVNAFIHGGKPPSTSGSLSINDQRLDPIMAQRRASSGSIDDNQDYSRRILRVTNA